METLTIIELGLPQGQRVTTPDWLLQEKARIVRETKAAQKRTEAYWEAVRQETLRNLGCK